VRLIGVNSDNDPPLRKRIWDRLGGDLRPRHLASIVNVEPFAALPAVMQAVTKGQIRGRTVIRSIPRRPELAELGAATPKSRARLVFAPY
jgi:hypothetical protein